MKGLQNQLKNSKKKEDKILKKEEEILKKEEEILDNSPKKKDNANIALKINEQDETIIP